MAFFKQIKFNLKGKNLIWKIKNDEKMKEQNKLKSYEKSILHKEKVEKIHKDRYNK